MAVPMASPSLWQAMVVEVVQHRVLRSSFAYPVVEWVTRFRRVGLPCDNSASQVGLDWWLGGFGKIS